MELKVSFLTCFCDFYGSLTSQEHLSILKHLGGNQQHRGCPACPSSLVKEAVSPRDLHCIMALADTTDFLLA